MKTEAAVTLKKNFKKKKRQSSVFNLAVNIIQKTYVLV